MSHEEIQKMLDAAEEAERNGNFQEAYREVQTIAEAIESADEIPALDRARAVRLQGSAALRAGKYSESLERYNLLLSMSERDGNKGGIASALANMGQIHSDLSNYSAALECFRKALAIDEEMGNRYGAAICLGCIGNLYQRLSDYSKALAYHSEALAIDEEIGSRSGAARDYGNIGIIYHILEEYSIALESYFKALALDEELGNKDGMARHLGNIGETYKSLDDLEKTQEYLLKALHLAEEIGAAWPRVHWLQAVGILYAEHKDVSADSGEAERYLKRAIAESTALGVKHITRDSSHCLYTVLKEQQRWQEALEMHESYVQLKDEINVEETRKQEAIREQQKEIELEQARASAELKATTGLLHRVLPQSIATRIIAGEQEIADYFPTVSILFADIAGFTPITAEMPAIAVVRFLNFVFARFDEIIKRHGCEKIKTIGDGYMAICGAPLECADHAERLAAAALEMREPIILPDDIRVHMPEWAKLRIRIGLHTGSIIAGVIGEERFVYDIYSDAVNTAARMESQGEQNRIHVSNDFYRHLQNRFAMTKNTTHGLTFEKRGDMEIKGKGMMRTWWLNKGVSV